jgi:hypothetical protein
MTIRNKVLLSGMSLSLVLASIGCTPAAVNNALDQIKPGSSTGSGTNTGTGTSTGTGSSTDSGTTTGGNAAVQPSADSPLTATHSGKAYENGATYLIPDNSPTAGAVALFSEYRERFTIDNPTDKEIKVESVELVGMGNVKPEEFILQDTPIGWRTDENPDRKLEIKDTVLAPKTALDVYFRFYPVGGGERKAQVVVTHDGGKKFVINLVGKGRPDGQLFSKGKLDFFKVIGSVKDEYTSTFAGDASGNIYFSANQKEILDKFYDDILVGSVGPDGSKRWLKIFNGPNKEFQPDPGQNNETGGNQHSTVMGPDGMLYIMGAASAVKQNNFFYHLVLKVNPANGELIWGKVWNCAQDSKTAVTSSTAYGLDVDDKYVYVTGQTGNPETIVDGLVSVLALNVADGSLKYQKAFDPVPGSIDRGYAIKSDGKGNLYIGGLSNGRGFLARLKEAQSDEPQLDWLKSVNMGVGSNVNGIDIDASGDAYLSLDRRGAQTFFSMARVSTTGELVWGKTYPGNFGDKSNTNLVKVIGDSLYVGGRTGQGEYDAQMGDGLFMKLSAADGKYDWGMFHFSGKGPDEMAEHRVKGMFMMGNDLYVGGQVYTGSMNHKRYQGYWYDATNPLEDYAPAISDITGVEMQTLNKGRIQDSSVSGKWVDAPADRVSVQDAMGKMDGSNSDGEIFLSKFTLK